MDAYKNLAVSYDRLTNDVDYNAVVDFYHAILENEGVKPRTVADLACGYVGGYADCGVRQGPVP